MPNTPIISHEATEAARARLERALLDATPHPFEANTPSEEYDIDGFYDDTRPAGAITLHLSLSAAHDLAHALEDYQLARTLGR